MAFEVLLAGLRAFPGRAWRSLTSVGCSSWACPNVGELLLAGARLSRSRQQVLVIDAVRLLLRSHSLDRGDLVHRLAQDVGCFSDASRNLDDLAVSEAVEQSVGD